jgi:hypothetical protein
MKNARLVALVLVGLFLVTSSLQAQEKQIKKAMSAAPASISADATILDGEGNVLKEGSNGWTCMVAGFGPVCLQGGTEGGSNTDPFATEATADNEWLPPGGPHIMIVVPDAAALEGLPTHPDDGGPWVMYRDTPYAHIMVPIKD